MNAISLLIVFTAGGSGCVVRYLIGFWVQRGGLPPAVGTLTSNVIACLVFALVLHIAALREVTAPVRLAMLTGFCGGLSTFSSFGYETFHLFRSGMAWLAVTNIAVSVGLSLLIFYIFSD